MNYTTIFPYGFPPPLLLPFPLDPVSQLRGTIVPVQYTAYSRNGAPQIASAYRGRPYVRLVMVYGLPLP